MLLDKSLMIREANILAGCCGSRSDGNRGGNKYLPRVVDPAFSTEGTNSEKQVVVDIFLLHL